MGARASTAGGGQSPRARTFSAGSGSDVVAGYSLHERQRARSLSSVPDLPEREQETAGPSEPEDLAPPAAAAASLALGRVYAAHSLPSHIWSINGKLYLFIK